jgi:hypothetical protein
MNLQTLLQNKHTTGAGLIYLGAAVVGHIGGIWFPAYTHQFEETTKAIKEGCFVWGMAFAGDAAKKTLDAGNPPSDFNTEQLKRALAQASDPKERILNPEKLPNKP